ncbi:zinc-dependent alcohol dehydrogenase family protein [Brevibacillus antibioticus]|uniref:Zinc-dependent alcohol dehydrogenase family protein n=1 Tax=Brevibacillus antibioticus TaxID=2570228 RepID=A0A4U2Y691_9BACL|nr:zinc-dependent alcohol dehydrogenase family protein [Brevibacillus antibioticus]TKI55292.1 zinc-dependent alcohol dehydrogenase family protein [Brevibacillus antibioticus]
MYAQVVRYDQFGEPHEVLKVEQRLIEPLKQAEILVKMSARPINPSDVIPIRGAYKHRINLPAIPGYEGVGTVVDTGPFAPHSLIGKRVLPLRGEGTWQEYVKTTAELAIAVPDSIQDDIASRLYINPITAWVICNEVLQLSSHQVLLVNAANSAIGRLFIQLSAHFGFRVIAIVRNARYTEELMQLGACHVIDSSRVSIYDTIMSITNGQGAHASIDSIGGPDGFELAKSTRAGGIFLSLGLLSGVQVDWSTISKELGVIPQLFLLRHWNQRVSVSTWHETFEKVIELVQNGKLLLAEPGEKFALHDVKDAVQFAENRPCTGKIILV